MKIKFLSILLVVSTVFISCKNEGQKGDGEKSVDKPFFSVEVEASAAKSDNFAMYFSEDGTTEFKDVNAVWHGIEGGGKAQKIEFVLKDDVTPTHIRLDFGLLKNQDSVVVKNVKVNYYDKVFEFKGADFFNYFIKDEQFAATTDAAAGTLTIVQKDGQYKSPYYYPTQLTIDNIAKITKESAEAK